jgi:hypothetical protein
MKPDLTKLTTDLRDAREAGRAAMGTDDGGTCNFDSLLIRTGRGRRFQRKSPALQAAIVESGVSCDAIDYGWRGKGYMIRLNVGWGQGMTRTRACEAAAKLLQARGWDVSVWYQAD